MAESLEMGIEEAAMDVGGNAATEEEASDAFGGPGSDNSEEKSYESEDSEDNKDSDDEVGTSICVGFKPHTTLTCFPARCCKCLQLMPVSYITAAFFCLCHLLFSLRILGLFHIVS